MSMHITNIGKEIAENIGAETIFKAYGPALVRLVEKENQTHPYDLQQTAFKVAKENMGTLLEKYELLDFKDEAYRKGLLLEDIYSIFGVMLRDKIFTDKGIPVPVRPSTAPTLTHSPVL
ncbi:MAG: hypothetical protein FWF24_02190 [Alphaproteobacteria bacterium]|nr:hypothetical protein [Alphaproteobacteria bacterium]